MGCGPDHWPLHAHEFGWPAGKEAHSLWVQTTVELGLPGIMMFMGFYLVTIWRCWLFLQRVRDTDDLWFTDAARMTIASLVGFMVAAQFVSLEALEIPYYVAMLGAGSLAVYSRMSQSEAAATQYAGYAFESDDSLASAGAHPQVEAYGYVDVPAQHAQEVAVRLNQRMSNWSSVNEPAVDWRDQIGKEPPAFGTTQTEQQDSFRIMN